jgi:hypothetical protein
MRGPGPRPPASAFTHLRMAGASLRGQGARKPRMNIADALASPGASLTALCPAVGPDEGKAVAVEPRDGQAGAGARACGLSCRKVHSKPRYWSPSRKRRRPRLPVCRRISWTAPKSGRSASVHARLTPRIYYTRCGSCAEETDPIPISRSHYCRIVAGLSDNLEIVNLGVISATRLRVRR